MARIKGVAVAFLPLREPAHAAVFAQGVKPAAAAGEKLVGIGLMPHIPDQFVFREIKREVERHGQFDSAQVRRKMPAGPADLFDQETADLIGQPVKLFITQFLYVIFFTDQFKSHNFLLSVLYYELYLSRYTSHLNSASR